MTTVQDVKPADVLQALMNSLQLGQPQTHRNMTVIPLFGKTFDALDYALGENLMKKGLLSFTEVSESGSVGHLLAHNTSSQKALLIEGEELRGAKQNRTINTTVLLKEQSKTVIPVTCTERDRWSYRHRRAPFREVFEHDRHQRDLRTRAAQRQIRRLRSTIRQLEQAILQARQMRERLIHVIEADSDYDPHEDQLQMINDFIRQNEQYLQTIRERLRQIQLMQTTDADNFYDDGYSESRRMEYDDYVSHRMRRLINESVSQSLLHSSMPRANQHRMWREIDDYMAAYKMDIPTSAFSEVKHRVKSRYEDYLDAYHCQDDQIGALILLDGSNISLQILPHKGKFSHVFDKFVTSHALDASLHAKRHHTTKVLSDEEALELANDFIRSISQSKMVTNPAVALGVDIRFMHPQAGGSALVYEDEPVYLFCYSRN